MIGNFHKKMLFAKENNISYVAFFAKYFFGKRSEVNYLSIL